MRITDSQMISQLLQATSKEGVQSSPTAKVGDILNAIVAEVLEQGLLLDVGGQLMKASVKSPQNFSPQDQVFLKVVQSDALQILVERVSPEELAAGEQQKVADGLTEALKALDLSATAKNQSLLESLNAFKNPLTADNVKQLQIQQSALETILTKLPEALKLDLPLKDLQNMTLRELAITIEKAISQQPLTGSAGTLTAEPDALPGGIQVAEGGSAVMQDGKGVQKEAAALLGQETAVKEGASDAKPLLVDLNKATHLEGSEKGLASQKPESEAVVDKKAIQILAEGLQLLKDPKEAQKALSFLMKMDIPATPQSLYAVNEIFSKTQLKTLLNDIIGTPVDSAKAQLAEKSLQTIKDILRSFAPETFKSQDQVQQLAKKLVDALKIMEESSSKSTVQNPDLAVSNKAFLDTMRTPQLPFVLAQFPLFINNKLETLELYVEKRQKGKPIDPEDTRIYLALTTEKLGQIGAMIEIYHRAITVTIDTREAPVKSFLDEHILEMKESLEALGYVMTVQTMLKEKSTKLQDLHEQFEPIQFARFDKKV